MNRQYSTNFDVQVIIKRLLAKETHLSYSALSAFKSSPREFIEYKTGKKEQTDAMLYGSMVHCLVLEPDDFDKRYFPLDDEDICAQIGGKKPRSTNKYKEWFATTAAEAGERDIVKPDDYKHAKAIAANIKKNRASAKILELCPKHETGIEWEYSNFKFKGFIDLDGEKARADLKTVPDATPRKVQRQIIEDGWYIQAAMYNSFDNSKKPYYIIAVDKGGGISVHELPARMMEIGAKHYERLIDNFNECILQDAFEQSHDFWSKRWDGIYTADIPGYFYE